MDMKRCKSKSVNPCRILELPFLIIYNILSRLTVETIFSCKCVCKTFLEILTDPYFAKLRLTEAPNVDDVLIIRDQKCISNFLLIHNNRPALEQTGSYYDPRPCQTLVMPASIYQSYNLVDIVDSCNGMLCLYCTNERPRRSIFYICNPILGEFYALPPPIKSRNRYLDYSGFGFCSKTKQYKVIRFVDHSICYIYTLGTSSWRKLPRNVSFPLGSLDIDGCSLNGNLHWINKCTTEISNYICYFNLESEQFSYISPPAQFDRNALIRDNYSKIGLLDGLLCFSYSLEVRYEAFVMKDYGAKDRCWTKELTIDLSTIPISRDMRYFVVNFLNNGDLYLKNSHDNLIAYNIWNGTIRLKLAKGGYHRNVKSFVPSFISLNEIAAAAGGHVEVVERKMGRNLWSDYCLRFIRSFKENTFPLLHQGPWKVQSYTLINKWISRNLKSIIRAEIYKTTQQIVGCIWWFRSITPKLGNCQMVSSNGKLVIMMLLYYSVLHKKRPLLKELVNPVLYMVLPRACLVAACEQRSRIFLS